MLVAREAVQRYKQRIRQMTRRQTGRSMDQIAQDLQAFLPGWKAYFQLAQTPKVWRGLDEWLRHRLRAIQLKFWCRGPTVYRGLRALGASRDMAAQISGGVGGDRSSLTGPYPDFRAFACAAASCAAGPSSGRPSRPG